MTAPNQGEAARTLPKGRFANQEELGWICEHCGQRAGQHRAAMDNCPGEHEGLHNNWRDTTFLRVMPAPLEVPTGLTGLKRYYPTGRMLRVGGEEAPNNAEYYLASEVDAMLAAKKEGVTGCLCCGGNDLVLVGHPDAHRKTLCNNCGCSWWEHLRSLPAAGVLREALYEKESAIASCEHDFHLCDKCGHQEDEFWQGTDMKALLEKPRAMAREALRLLPEDKRGGDDAEA